MYIAGGFSTMDNENFNYEITVQIQDLTSKSWSYGCLNEPRIWAKNLPAHTLGEKIYFLGSWADNFNWDHMNNLESYDLQENKWMLATEGTQDSKILSGIVKNQKFYLLSAQMKETQGGLTRTNILYETTF